jgi:NADPH:quinone reductase-like Zn-dependent oxidoreductase
VKAAVRFRYGSPDVVEVREVDRPIPTQGQVLVRVHAASVNRADLDGLYPRWFLYRLVAGLRKPRSPRLGLDVAGMVESVGPGVTRFKPGDRVFGDLFAFGQGAFAEYVCAGEKAFATVPPGMAFEDAATLPHSAVLAEQGLRLRNGRTIRAGDRVLIDGASGNVGPFAIQIAKARGAAVTGTCRTEKVDFVRSLGADQVIDYTQVDYTRSGERYDWILDVDSHHSVVAARRALLPNGVYVTLGGSVASLLGNALLGAVLSMTGSRQMGMMLWWRPFNAAAEDVATIKELIAAGSLKPCIDRRYPLDETAEALRYVDEGRSKGKVVITF